MTQAAPEESLVRHTGGKRQRACSVDIVEFEVAAANSHQIGQLVVCLCPTIDIVRTVRCNSFRVLYLRYTSVACH